MSHSTCESCSYLERRGRRFQYRHTAQAAAQEVGVPVLWVWYLASRGRLRSKMWLGEAWFRLEDVENLVSLEATDTFIATKGYLSESERRGVLRRFPWVEKELARRNRRFRQLADAIIPDTQDEPSYQ